MIANWHPKNLDRVVRKVLEAQGYDVDGLIQNKDSYYKVYAIPKKDGSKRMITAPDKKMKEALRIVDGVLREVGPWPSPFAHGFKKNRSAVTNALAHTHDGNVKVLLAMDIRNFFPNIRKDRIVELYGEIVGELCTFHDRAGQGIPTSPWISNVILTKMDYETYNWCLHQSPKLRYTRYADDITISSKENCDMGKVKSKVRKIIRKYGFDIKPQKTRIQRPHQRMMITGIVINEHMGVPKVYRRKVRAAIHNLKYSVEKDEGKIQEIQGKIAWIQAANKEQGVKLKGDLIEAIAFEPTLDTSTA